MALPSTIFKVQLNVSDMDRHHYDDYQLTVARHPSETDERMMMRILAFALNADEQLGFTRGLCADDEPDLWQKSLTGEIDLWIDVGLPDERRVRKACYRSKAVHLYIYGVRAAELWWQKNGTKLQRFDNLTVIEVPQSDELTQLVQRGMELQCTIQDGAIWLSEGEKSCEVSPVVRKEKKG